MGQDPDPQEGSFGRTKAWDVAQVKNLVIVQQLQESLTIMANIEVQAACKVNCLKEEGVCPGFPWDSPRVLSLKSSFSFMALLKPGA